MNTTSLMSTSSLMLKFIREEILKDHSSRKNLIQISLLVVKVGIMIYQRLLMILGIGRL